MRWIRKGQEPKSFTNWKALASQNWTPSWDDLQNPEKGKIRRALVEEQGFLCCYCCMRIGLEAEWSHIEHLRPRSRPGFEGLALDYGNMLASCGPRYDGADPTTPYPRHCGALKNDWFDEALMVSPLDPECQENFRFTAAGEIRPVDDEARKPAAQTTIEKLGLDIPLLRANRQQAIDGALHGLELDDEGEVKRLAEALDQPDGEGRFTPFSSAVAHVLRGLLS